MVISPATVRPATVGAPEYFTGSVHVTPLFQPTAPSRSSGASVTFEPGARSAWHTHPLGQTLIITAGTGWVQQEGGDKREIRAGDVIWTPPGIKHWHGASPSNAISHIAIQEAQDGAPVAWLEHVSDAQYLGDEGTGGTDTEHLRSRFSPAASLRPTATAATSSGTPTPPRRVAQQNSGPM